MLLRNEEVKQKTERKESGNFHSIITLNISYNTKSKNATSIHRHEKGYCFVKRIPLDNEMDIIYNNYVK